jgi:hypothetical protein
MNSKLKYALLISVLVFTSGCDTNNRDMSGMGVSRLNFEGCNYLVFKLLGNYGDSVVLDPKPQPAECGSLIK